MFKRFRHKMSKAFSRKKKTSEVAQTRSDDSPARDSPQLEAKRQASLKPQELTSPAGRDPNQMWKMRLHVIGGKERTMGGHALISLIDPSGKNEMVMGMRTYGGASDSSLPASTAGPLHMLKMSTVGNPGVINDDSVVLNRDIPRDNDALVSQTWDVSERQALAAMAKFNRDRRLNQERLPDLSKEDGWGLRRRMAGVERGDPAHLKEEAGGPHYNMVTRNCADYALSVIQETQNPKALKKMPGIPGQTDTRIDTSRFRHRGLALPHHIRKHLPEKGAAQDYRERVKGVDVQKREWDDARREFELEQRRKRIFKQVSEHPEHWSDPHSLRLLTEAVGDQEAAKMLVNILSERDANVEPGTKLSEQELQGVSPEYRKALKKIGAVEEEPEIEEQPQEKKRPVLDREL